MKSFSRTARKVGKQEFVRFASVVGDFNPIHYDRDFAEQSKLPSVVAQGPLVMLLALDAIAAEGEFNQVKRFAARIVGPVFPDLDLTVEQKENGEIQVLDQGRVVLAGNVARGPEGED